MVSEQPLGMYGKIPVLGDFVTRRLPREFVQPWDEWLQNGLSASRKFLGENWLNIYLISPIWRFILSPGVCGEKAWAGVLIPSVDKVGRYFPLTLVRRIAGEHAVPGLFVKAEKWFCTVEELALSALQDDFNMADFDDEPGPPFPYASKSFKGAPCKNCEDHEQPIFSIEMETPADTPSALIHLGDSLIRKQMPAYSAWSCTGSDHVRPGLRIYETFPPADAYTDFLADRVNQQRRSDIEPN